MLSFFPHRDLDLDLDRSMRLRRRIPVFIGLLVFLAAIAVVVFLRKHAPPEAARLLPGADGFVYVNLQWMRRADVGGHAATPQHDPEYERFIQETGFDFERDLAQAAIAVHYPSPATGGETRYSEVFVGKVDGEKLRDYLKKAATSVENFEHVDIFNIPVEGHTFRIAILGVEFCTPHLCTMIAGSNHPDVEVIHGIINRSHKVASPFGGPALLRQFYKHVPQLPLPSLGWAIFGVKPAVPVANSPLALQGPATIVASVQYLGDVHFRAEAFAKDEAAAQQLSLQANTFLKIFESAEVSVSGQEHDADFDKAMKSIQIEQKKERVVLTARVPSTLVRKLVSEAPTGLTPGSPKN
jgi:hypothetical protein